MKKWSQYKMVVWDGWKNKWREVIVGKLFSTQGAVRVFPGPLRAPPVAREHEWGGEHKPSQQKFDVDKDAHFAKKTQIDKCLNKQFVSSYAQKQKVEDYIH